MELGAEITFFIGDFLGVYFADSFTAWKQHWFMLKLRTKLAVEQFIQLLKFGHFNILKVFLNYKKT